MKKLLMILLAGCVFVISQSFQHVAADENGIPLHKLAGTYATTVQGSFFLCFESTPPFALAPCGSAGSIGSPVTALAVGAATSDANGTSCATWTETDTFSPVNALPPTVAVVHQTATATSYDQATGTGDGSFTNYFGGTCNGATLDSTGATVASSGTYHFVVSDKGKRIDTVATSLTSPLGVIGGFSISGVNRRQ